MSDVTELTPAEEAAARAKEQAEQEALPYKWTQTIGDVDITILVPGNLKGKDMVVEIKKQSLTAGIKGQEPVIKVTNLLAYISTNHNPCNFPTPLYHTTQYRTPSSSILTSPTKPGRPPTPDPPRRFNLDAVPRSRRSKSPGDPSRKAQQARMVAARSHQRPENRREQDRSREQQAVGPRGRDAGNGGEDDVRPKTKGDGVADER